MEAFDQFSSGNPIAELEELCRWKGYAPPCYTMFADWSLSFNEFSFSCKANRLTVYGRGATEEMAKNNSAINMIRALNQTPEWMNPQLPMPIQPSASFINGPMPGASVENQYATIVTQHCLEQALEVPKKGPAKPDAPKRTVQVRATKDKKEGLKMEAARPSTAGGSTKKDESASNVQEQKIMLPEVLNPKKMSYMRLLELTLGEEYNISYVDIDEGSGSGERQCILQLMPKTMPIHYGCGSSTEEARNTAAQRALKNCFCVDRKVYLR